MTKTQREAVKLLRAVAPRKAPVPILTHALLDSAGARVTDLDGVEARVSAEALGVTVEGTGALGVADLKVAIESGAEWLRFEGARCKWSGGEFVALPAEDFPVPLVPSDAAGDGVRDAAGLPAALAVVAGAMTADDARYSLNGAGLATLGKVVASDGHRLHLATGPLLGLDEETWVVPALAVKLLAGWKGALTVERFGDALVFEAGGLRLTARRLEGRFPNYAKVFPAETPHRWTVEADEFMRVTEGLHKFSDKRTHATVVEANGALTLTAKGADGDGEMRASVPIEWLQGADSPVRFGMNLGYLRDAVEALGGTVEMRGSAGKGEGLIVDALHLTGARGEAVIMPMRI